MRKSALVLLAIVLGIALLVSCNGNPAADNMTESYRNGRQSFYKATKIWLPQLEGVEILQIFIEEDGHWVSMSFESGEEVFSQIASLFRNEIEKDPDVDFDDFQLWDELQYTDGGQIYCGNIAVSILKGDSGNTEIGLFGHFFKGSVVEVMAAPEAGGSVSIKQAGDEKGQKITTSIGSHLDLVATAADGYQFAGWFIGDTKISDAATYKDYVVPESDVVVEGRFTQVSMTESYAEGRNQLYLLTGVHILPIADRELLGSSDIDGSDGVVCFDIPASAEEYQALHASMREGIGRDPDYSEENIASWYLEHSSGDDVWVGDFFIIHDEENGAVYINCIMGKMTEYYMAARDRFYSLTGVLLPDLPGIATEDDEDDLAAIESWDLGVSSGITFDIWGGAEDSDWYAIKNCLDEAWGAGTVGEGYISWSVPSLTTWYFKLYDLVDENIMLNLEPGI
ncbi:MAG: hypothetical protein ILP16_01875 [Spirochaetales bacterium]|nr:hypothetical protein [Spirochaetales bacterium]